jgi:hypothetical protein
MKLSQLFEEKQIIVESPSLIDNIDDHPLFDLQSNRRALEKLNKLDLRVIKQLSDTTALYTAQKRDRTVYAAINHNAKIITYYMEFETNHHVAIGRYGAQAFVWVDQFDKSVRSLPKAVFFDYALKNVGVIATDSLQTPKGKDFWLRRLKEAFDRNLFVYYVNIVSDQIKQLHEFSDVKEFDMKYKIWTKSLEGTGKLLMISEHKII